MEGCQPARFHVHASANWLLARHGMSWQGSSMPRHLPRMNMLALIHPTVATLQLACRRLNSREEATLAETTVSLHEGTAHAGDMASGPAPLDRVTCSVGDGVCCHCCAWQHRLTSSPEPRGRQRSLRPSASQKTVPRARNARQLSRGPHVKSAPTVPTRPLLESNLMSAPGSRCVCVPSLASVPSSSSLCQLSCTLPEPRRHLFTSLPPPPLLHLS